MTWYRHPYVLRFVLVLTIAGLLGCSRFRSHRRLNLKPFAEDMIAIAGDIQYGLGQVSVIYLQDFTDIPEVNHLDVMALKVRQLIRETIAYAIQVVTLAESRQTDIEKSKALASYLDGLLRPVLSQPRPPLNISVARLDTIVDDVASQEHFLDALAAAQPIIDETARVGGEVFEDTKNALDDAVTAIQVKINEQVRPIVDADKLLRDAQIQTTFNLRYLRDYRQGDETALDSLLKYEPSLHEFDWPEGKPTQEFMRSVEERLFTKLSALRQVRDQLRPDVELYWRQQEELEKITASYNTALRQARVAVLAWARAHARLAAGVTDPAQIDLLGIARKAAGNVAPIP